jgi:carbonic anhydrase
MQARSFIRSAVPWIALIAILAGNYLNWTTRNANQGFESSPPNNVHSAINELRNGNRRFVNSHRTRSTDTDHDDELRLLTAKAQHPFVAVLACSDSRVCPEFIFDQRVGSIFEIRNAGNVVDEDVLASLEYAVEHLNVPLILVLGHKGCGAIEAVCKAGEQPLHHHLNALQLHMRGIRQQLIDNDHKHDPQTVNRLAEENAREQSLTILRDSTVVADAVRLGTCRLVYGLYDMQTGEATFFEIPPGSLAKR